MSDIMLAVAGGYDLIETFTGLLPGTPQLLIQANPLRYAFGIDNHFAATVFLTQSADAISPQGFGINNSTHEWFDMPKFGVFVTRPWFLYSNPPNAQVTIFEIVKLQRG